MNVRPGKLKSVIVVVTYAFFNSAVKNVCAITLNSRAPTAFVGLGNIRLKHQSMTSKLFPVRMSTLQTPTTISNTEPTPNTEPSNNNASKDKILVLGGTGFVGGEICRQLNARNINYVATSTNGRGSTISLDLTDPAVSETIQSLCDSEQFTSIISTVGSIGKADDEQINNSCGAAIVAAGNSKSVSRFISIGNPERVRDFARSIGPLSGYVAGKESSERILADVFGNDGCVIRPTFIYGGSEFALNPPRVASSVGNLAEAALSLPPLPALAKILPGPLGLAMEAPISVEDVAAACINAAIGLPGLEDKESIEANEISIAASKRPRSPGVLKSIEISKKNDPAAALKRRDGLKRGLVQAAVTNMNIADNEEEAYTTAEEIMEELEPLRPKARPSSDGSMNARWAFVFTGKPTVGMKLLNSLSRLSELFKFIFEFEDTFLDIGDKQSTVKVVVAIKVLGIPLELVILSKLVPDKECKHGTMMSERLDGVSFAGIKVPVPEMLQTPRSMEITYIDDDILIARTAGAEPHFLLRESPCKPNDETCSIEDIPSPYYEEAREKFGNKIAQNLLDRSLVRVKGS